MIKANAKWVKLVVEVDLNFRLTWLKYQKLGGWSKFERIYFILPRIPLIVILSDREKMLKIWREVTDLDPWTLPGPTVTDIDT